MPRPEGWKAPRRPARHVSGQPELVPIISDPHCPFHEPIIIDAFAAWLDEHRPARAYILGDESDLPSLGKYRKNPRMHCTVQECIDSTYDVLAKWRAASPETEMTILAANHTHGRLDGYVLDNAPELHGLSRAHEEEELLSMPYLLRLDELDISYVEAEGEYHDSTIEIAPGIIAMHGTAAGVHGGAIREIGNWEGSVIQGHDHKSVLAARIRRRPDNTEVLRWAWSIGAASQRDLGYTAKRDVAQGFGVLTLHSDGRWQPEPASYDPEYNDVTWRSWRYRAE